MLVPSSSNNTQLTLFCTVIVLKWPVIFCSMFILSRLQLLINVNKLIHLNNLTEHKHQSMLQQILVEGEMVGYDLYPSNLCPKGHCPCVRQPLCFLCADLLVGGSSKHSMVEARKKKIKLNRYVLP